MPRIAYEERRFSPAVLALIAKCNEIIEEYQAQGFDLTLRQLYYQLVSRDIIPNTVRDYKRLGQHVNNARMCGLIDWHAIVDRGRNLRALAHWTDPAEIIRAARQGFRL